MKYLLLIPIISLIACTPGQQYYAIQDFQSVDKIDSHVHVRTTRDAFAKQARKDGFQLLNIVVDSRDSAYVEEQFAYCLDQKNRHPEDFEFATAFSVQNWEEPDWVAQTLAGLEEDIAVGAIAVKVWKNIGMVLRNQNGNLVMVDNPRLDTIFKFLARKQIPVIGHLGEPKNCWLPIDEMTTNNDKSYFKEHPEYHMYLHPEMPSYEEQIAARDRMLENNPDLIFIGAHMGSLEWSVAELAQRLDRFPNMAVDLAARMGQIFYQTQANREEVRDFFIKYQDRLLYATDLGDRGNGDPEDLQQRLHETWFFDWQFFTSADQLTSPLIDGPFQGLQLPKEVVDKLYYTNAKTWLKM